MDKALSDMLVLCYTILQGIGGQNKGQIALEYCGKKRDISYLAIF